MTKHNGLRIWHYHSYGIGLSYGSDSIPGPGASMCHSCVKKKKLSKVVKRNYLN